MTTIAPAAPPLAAARAAAQPAPCLVCGHAGPEVFFDLGDTALANNLASSAGAPGPRFPLRAAYCPACHHVQLADRVAPEAMFENYLYVSSASSTLSAHFQDLAAEAARRAGLAPGDLAIDIGSNDGSLLEAIATHSGARVRGVDPAANLAPLALARGVETETAFFDLATARRLRERLGPARLITATNSLPHIPEPAGYLDGIGELLAPGGVFAVEAHYLGDLIGQLAFDTIYHEHVSYWALGPLARLAARHGLEVFDAERLAIHHGQLRVWMGRRGEHAVSPAVARLDAAEETLGLRRRQTFTGFARQAQALANTFGSTVRRLASQDGGVAGYGAPAKASTLLDYCGLTGADIAWIADRNPLKQGRFMPGSGIPVVNPARIEAERPGVLIVFAWNFAGEIIAQLDWHRRAGGRFLIPIPEARLV